MESMSALAGGFSAAFGIYNLLFCLLGCLLGTLIGVLPGIGPLATIAMLLPITFAMDPLTSLIMLAGIYYGAQYGGSTTAILLNLPGETSSVVTCLDGYEMAKRGRAGAALAIAALSSFFAGCVATLFIALLAPSLAAFSMQVRSPEYVVLIALGLVASVVLSRGSPLKAVAMALLGLLFGTLGTDVTSGETRFVENILPLYDGLSFVALALGLFGLAELLSNLEHPEARGTLVGRITRLWPSLDDFRQAWKAVLRGTGLGSVMGLLPGSGAAVASFTSYVVEKRFAHDPSRFGYGAVEGVAGPEAANNAAAQTSFIPLLMLGIPGTATMALMMGALMMQGIAPGSAIVTTNPTLFWGLIASMWIGNLMLLVINLPMIGLWVKMLSVPYRILFPSILLFSCIGVYSLNSSSFDVWMLAVFAAAGYALRKLDCDAAPLLIAFILGPLLEEHLRRALVISRGSPMIFIERPIALGLIICVVALIGLIILPSFRAKREEAFHE